MVAGRDQGRAHGAGQGSCRRVEVHSLDHEGEDIRVEVLPADAAIAELFTGRVNSTTAIVALQWLSAHRARLRARWQNGPGVGL